MQIRLKFSIFGMNKMELECDVNKSVMTVL